MGWEVAGNMGACFPSLDGDIMETEENDLVVSLDLLFGVSLPREGSLLEDWDCELSQPQEVLFNDEK